LRSASLPDPRDILALENIEHALLCMSDEQWNAVVRAAITEGRHKQKTGNSLFDDIENELENGGDFNALLERIK